MSAAAPPAPGRIGVVLANLGTPDAATTPAVRRYLRQFLSDARVVEVPRPVWWCILNLFILPLRSPRSAAKYASIWTSEGSPLLAISRRQHAALGAVLRARGLDVELELAMRYGQPSLEGAWQRLRKAGVDRLLLLPLYPQYSATTIASTVDALADTLRSERNQPAVRTVRGFATDPGYIAAMAASVRAYWDANGRPDRLLLSFHGLPKRNVELGDPYADECRQTAGALGAALGLAPGDYDLCFQSRFGPAKWLEPATSATLLALAARGVGRVDVFCPGFAADCLETLEEIAVEGRHDFLAHGGRDLRLIPCVNDAPGFIDALADLVERQVRGWGSQEFSP
jgi:ferrochelatase